MKPGRRGDGVGGREVFRDLIQKDLEEGKNAQERKGKSVREGKRETERVHREIEKFRGEKKERESD